jgi:hypothetical protein
MKPNLAALCLLVLALTAGYAGTPADLKLVGDWDVLVTFKEARPLTTTVAPQHQIALADASRRYGRLWRQGIPYSSLMLNSINHPDARGMKIFADALMELFP